MTTLDVTPRDAPLAALLPPAGEALAPDAVLDRFVSGRRDRARAHQEAILQLDERHLVLNTPTGRGVARRDVPALPGDGRRRSSFYTCPIKALVNEKFFDLCRLLRPRQRRDDDRTGR